MESIRVFFENIWHVRIVNTILIVLVSITIYKLIVYFLEKGEEKNSIKLFTSKKSKTYFRLLKSIIRYIFLIITTFILLDLYGVDISSVLAGVGILGVVLGLAIQDWLKDIIRGSSILSDDYFAVGDVVKYGEIEGKVLVIGLKTTKIQELRTQNIISIANRNIEQVELVSNMILINIPMSYKVPVTIAENTIEDIFNLIKQVKDVEGTQYKGVNEFDSSDIKYQIAVFCKPINKLQVRRDSLRCVLLGMEKNGLEIPYTQIDIHTK